jgi:hypothetical protein
MIYLDSMGHLLSDESFGESYQFGVKKLKLKPQYNHYSRHLNDKKYWFKRQGLFEQEIFRVDFNKVLEIERKIGATQRSLF